MSWKDGLAKVIAVTLRQAQGDRVSPSAGSGQALSKPLDRPFDKLRTGPVEPREEIIAQVHFQRQHYGNEGTRKDYFVRLCKGLRSKMKNTAFILCLAVIVLSPMLFGSVFAFAYSLVFILILFAGFFSLQASIKKDAASGIYQFCWPSNPLLPLFLLFVVYLTITMISLPAPLIKQLTISPLVIAEKSLPAAAVKSYSLNDFWLSISPYVYPVRQSLVRWIIYGLFLWCLLTVLNTRQRIEISIVVLLCIGCVESLYGIIQTYSGHEHIWWYKKTAHVGYPSGTYTNRNHFAGFLEIGIILSIAYGVVLYDRHRRRQQVSKSPHKKFKLRLLGLFSEDQLYAKIFLVVFSGAVMGLGLFLSASRGGIISLSLALIVMGAFFACIKTYRRAGLYILLPFLALTSIYGIYAGIDATVDRFRLFDNDFLDRAVLAEKTLRMFDDYQLFGVGLGNLPYLYPKYQDVMHLGSFINYAHNDWAQLLAEGGIFGFALMLVGIGYYVFCVLRKWKKAHSAFAVCLGLVPIIVLVSLGVHSLSDYNLHIPANMIALIAVMAIGWRAFYVEQGKTDQGFFHFPLQATAILIIFAVGATMLWSGSWVIRHFVSEAYCNTIQTPPLRLDQHPSASSVREALKWDDSNARVRFKLAAALMKERDRKMMDVASLERPQDNSMIIKTLEETIRLNPFTAEYHLRLGWEYSYLWYNRDYQTRWLPAADLCMERAAYFYGEGAENPYLHVEMGKYWTMRSKTLEYDQARQDEAWTKARWHFKKALELNRGRVTKENITGYVKNFYADQKRLKESVE